MNNLKLSNVINKMFSAQTWAEKKVVDETVSSCNCRICRGFTPVAYINNSLGSVYKLRKEFSGSIYASIILLEIIGMDFDMTLEERQTLLEEIIEERGVTDVILECVDVFLDLLGIEDWHAQYLSEDNNEFNILCQLKCDYTVPEEYINSTFPNFMFEKEVTLPEKRYHTFHIGGGLVLPIVDNFIIGLCEELGVYVDCSFE